jgi:hypothetical protein
MCLRTRKNPIPLQSLTYKGTLLHVSQDQKEPYPPPKSSIEVTKCTSSNILVWFGRDAPEKSVAGLREGLISSPFENLQKD